MELQALLEKSTREHYKLCPQQIPGLRLGMAGLAALEHETAPGDCTQSENNVILQQAGI